ncbi:glycerophosphodiester phosphodiesterase family protein [Gallaecimonas pentaromativorans]|uniref:glycerophosphodiester phosphodiesterase n=1 Tax=Gallaecimonas pentaromativorans TaxID=584787 RepID=A0A3N1PNZ6_9GAMM|nr:glycerophosphodiester phosphodiesterase family protein [Gallaecimonas pentaromativorans]ROQ30455.1 glycerophosphoryl diester phosphodiesterase [Gallaecimonas pentaromativorans]
MLRYLLLTCLALGGCQSAPKVPAQVGPRPFYLVDDMSPGPLKDRLEQCRTGPFYRSDFVFGHRGAPLQFPEHTQEAYQAGAVMGAGTLECDVTFTKDKELVCRHSQCDLATTTNVLLIPDLAAKCSVPFTPANGDQPAQAQCCTSDFTLAEFKRLKGKMDGFNPRAQTPAQYLLGSPGWRTDLYSQTGTLTTLKDSIALFKKLGVKQTPELKAPMVRMPFNGMTQQAYAQKLIDTFVDAGIDPKDVFPQSFNLEDIRYWLKAAPAFGKQGVFLDERDEQPGFDPMNAASWQPSMAELKAEGVNILAPPLWMLVTLDENGQIVPSAYAKAAKAAGLDIITWSFERSGPLAGGGGWYYQSIAKAIHKDGDRMTLLDVLARQVGVRAIFSDWPGTVTYYANCMGLD